MTYRVSFPEPIRRRLLLVQKKVLAVGQGKELGRVLSEILQDLTERPMEVGEVMYHLGHIPMPVKLLAREYLAVVFAVHDAGKNVMVTNMKMLDHHPFPQGYEEYLNT